MITQCVVGVLFHVEAVSLTCDNCPGTEFTCTCSVNSTGVIWRLPGSEIIVLDDKVGSNSTTTNGIFFAVVTNNTGVVLESMLIYTANASLVNATIECEEHGDGQLRSASAIAG